LHFRDILEKSNLIGRTIISLFTRTIPGFGVVFIISDNLFKTNISKGMSHIYDWIDPEYCHIVKDRPVPPRLRKVGYQS
jgi:hypothetical protein